MFVDEPPTETRLCLITCLAMIIMTRGRNVRIRRVACMTLCAGPRLRTRTIRHRFHQVFLRQVVKIDVHPLHEK